jgi:hypothetical protein
MFQLLKHTPVSHPNRDFIEKVGVFIKQMTADLNKSMEESLEMERFVAIASKLEAGSKVSTLDILQPHRRILLDNSGSLTTVSLNKKAPSPHWILGTLLYVYIYTINTLLTHDIYTCI